MRSFLLLALVSVPAQCDQSGASCASHWTCPSTWKDKESKLPKDIKDAKEFIASVNIYRCMHDVQSVIWDEDVYEDKKGDDEDKEGKAPGNTRAETFPFSEHRGVDAAHIWYSEMEDCDYKESCFRSSDAENFKAMIWDSVGKVGYRQEKGESSRAKSATVGLFRRCDEKPLDITKDEQKHVPMPKKDFDECLEAVLKCDTFKGLAPKDVEGCDAHAKASGNVNMVNTMKWSVEYGKKCKAKYDKMKDKTSKKDKKTLRRFNIDARFEVFQPSAANMWFLGLACAALTFVGVVVVRRSFKKSEVSQAKTFTPLKYVVEERIEEDGLE